MSLLERGFKTWAERYAEGLRKELQLDLSDQMEMGRLASFFSARLLVPSDIAGMTEQHLHQLLRVDPSGWSAVTVVMNEEAVIIYNPHHSKGRQASDICHEISHLALEHEPTKLVMSPDGSLVMRNFNQRQEEEANWLAWCILLPREALVTALRRRASVEEIANHFGVSTPLVKFRVQKTGAQIQYRRGRSA